MLPKSDRFIIQDIAQCLLLLKTLQDWRFLKLVQYLEKKLTWLERHADLAWKAGRRGRVEGKWSSEGVGYGGMRHNKWLLW